MKKKGFTLIELLAVIVVLAIIALISTPIVMNVIKNAQAGAAERSADNYVKAVDLLISTNKLDGKKVEDGSYTIDSNGNLTFGTVEVSGTKPNGGTIQIENGQVVKNASSIVVGDYTVTYKDGKANASEKSDALVLCTAIAPSIQDIYDFETQTMTTVTAGVQATSEAPYAKGAVYSCDLGDGARTFYVLKEDGENVKLIMNENVGSPVAWCASDDDNSCAADGAKAYLESQTIGWSKLKEMGGTVALPTIDEMSSVSGQTWMCVNLNNNPGGYWTSTPSSYDSYDAYIVNSVGDTDTGDVRSGNQYGVRPVITISKSNMSL